MVERGAMRTRGARVAGLAVLLAVLGACVTERVETRREPTVLTRPPERPSLRVTLTTDRKVYAPEQPVEMTLTLVNTGTVPVTMTVPTSQLYEFTVLRGGREVWRWGHDKMFLPALTDVVLAPGQTGVYRVTWDRRGNDGQPVPKGEYVVRGVWLGGEQYGLKPLELSFILR